MTTDDPLVELREALNNGVEAARDLLYALEAVPAAMEAALIVSDDQRRVLIRSAARRSATLPPWEN